ncbi:Cysteine-rich RLK (RECEPTOR-like protein kinase) 8 [Theobroma cacao]|uniref:Cysteine-rich RLK (RECEPTOR-like protein kinase) 8 n=1 Tax=Theobroma cacao TaxID=3641 RepID=A0A061GBS1_THECC|nr:Cysteine-rich RLK (RECEPTOR-like protein kinase) 8 [Theobroma cacao]
MHDEYMEDFDAYSPYQHYQQHTTPKLCSPEPSSSSETPSSLNSNDISLNPPFNDSISPTADSFSVDMSTSQEAVAPTRKSTRQKQPPKYLDAYYVDIPSQSNSVTLHPITKNLSTKQLSPAHKAFAIALSHIHEPNSCHQAINYCHWREAMDLELKALQDNGTWTIVPLPSNPHVIGCKWVYKIKMKANGEIERYKARLVAKGYSQVVGFDYQETFSPVAKQSTVRVFFALAAANGWSLSQLDINNAFFNGDLDEEVYMEIAQGYAI